MQIEQPYYLLALLLVLVVTWLYFRYRRWRKKVLQQFGEWALVVQLIPGNSSLRPLLKFILPVMAFILIIIGLTNVQSGNATRTIRHEGIDLAIVLDVSNSMLAADEAPNRLGVAKMFAAQLIDELPDARIALITFAGIPVLQTPLTIDHTAAQLLLSSISADDVPEQGSDIGAALHEAIKALPENQQHYRAIVLISDGEDQEGGVEQALETIKQNQVAVCCVGIGTETGATIPESTEGI
ncbi:MAG: VWA domain-containing protein, partial [Chitinophagales bacterium]